MKIDNLLLPSTVLSKGCYQEMFNYCTGYMGHGDDYAAGGKIELPATELVQDAYADMFADSDIRYIKAGVPSSQLNITYTLGWLDSVTSAGTFESTDPSFDVSIQRGATTIPVGWDIIVPQPAEGGLWLNTKKVNFLFINGKQVAELYLNGKKVGYEAPEPPGPDPRDTNFRITNIGNGMTHPDDTWTVKVKLPSQCDMTVYHSDSGDTTTLTPGQTTTLTLPYGEYLEFWGNNQHGLYPDDEYTIVTCPEDGSYEASGQLSSLAKQDAKEVGYSFYGLFTNNLGLVKAGNLVLPGGYDGLAETYYGMFSGCSSLEEGPEGIPYLTGTNQYENMFNGCSSLKSIRVNWTEWPELDNTRTWLSGASADGTFKCPTALVIPNRTADYVPEGWTIQRT